MYLKVKDDKVVEAQLRVQAVHHNGAHSCACETQYNTMVHTVVHVKHNTIHIKQAEHLYLRNTLHKLEPNKHMLHGANAYSAKCNHDKLANSKDGIMQQQADTEYRV